jgi:hypothetical protein
MSAKGLDESQKDERVAWSSTQMAPNCQSKVVSGTDLARVIKITSPLSPLFGALTSASITPGVMPDCELSKS